MASPPFLVAAIVAILAGIAGLDVLVWQAVKAVRHPGPSSPARRDPPETGPPSLAPILLAAGCVLALLVGLVAFVVGRHGVVGFDQAADDAFRPYRASWLLKAAEWVTAIGAGPSLAAILGTATALLWSGNRKHALPALWIAFLGAQATTWIAKYVIARPRPVFLAGITEWNPSFPSGHATATTALIGMLGLIVAAHLPGLRARFEVRFWTSVLVALICFSRIFLGVHFVTDVAAGILVGVFWLLVGTAVGRPRNRGEG